MTWRTAALLAPWLAVTAPLVPLGSQAAESAGEIRFSEPDRKIEFHPRGEIEPRQGSTFEFLDRGNSLGGVMFGGEISSAPSGPTSNPRLLEFFSRQLGDRHMRFDGAEAPDSQAAFEQALGVNAHWSSRTQGKPASAEPFSLFNESPAPGDGARDAGNGQWNWSSRNRSLQDSRGTAGWESGTSDSGKDLQISPSAFDVNRPLAAGVVLPSALWNRTSPSSRPGETPLPNSLAPARNEPQERRPESLRNVLAASGGINPLAIGFDPINLNFDATRQLVNPVLPVTPQSRLTDPARNPLFDAPESNLEKPLSSSESRSLDLRIEALGSSSLAPKIISTPAQQLAPRPFSPGPTPFPERRF